MNRVAAAIVAAAAIAAVIAILTVMGPGADEEPPIPVGFNNNAVAQGVASPDEAAELNERVGADIDRVQIDWDRLEPSRGAYEWGTYDEIYRADLELGVRPLFIFAYAPEWANGGVCPEGAPACHAPPDPKHVADAASTAAAIAERYPDAAGIEIWNEPNLPYFWRPRADPAAYADLLMASYAAIKEVDPKMPVAGGSTSDSLTEQPGQLAAAEFVRGIYDAGAGEKMDALSIHLYADQVDLIGASAVTDVEDVREGLPPGAEVPLWITETGTTTTGPQAVSPEEQAIALLNVTEKLAEVPGVEMVLVHTLVVPPRGLASAQTGYGIVKPDLTPLPAFCALGERWGGDDVCPE